MSHRRSLRRTILLAIILATLVGVCWSGSVGTAMTRMPVRELDQETEETRDDTEELTVGPTAGRRASRRQSQRRKARRNARRGISAEWFAGRDGLIGLTRFSAAGVFSRRTPGLVELLPHEEDGGVSITCQFVTAINADRLLISRVSFLQRSQSRFRVLEELSQRNGMGSWLRC